jgi:hypothetical protein
MVVCPPLPARLGGFGIVVFILLLGIVLGDNKKNKSATLSRCLKPIRYVCVLKI